METNGIGKRLAVGAVAGLIGTLLMQSVRKTKQKWAPEAEAPMKEDPGKFVVEQAEKVLPAETRSRISESAESTAGQLLGAAYGTSFGIGYAGLQGGTGSILLDGTLLGLGVWAAGYLGWLPAAGLTAPAWKHRGKRLWVPVAEHVLYGVATAAGYHLLRGRSGKSLLS